MTRDDLPDVVERALKEIGGTGTVVQVAKQIWEKRRNESKASGELLFTWQYDMRWAAQRLRDAGKLNYIRQSGRSAWQLVRG